MSRSIQFLHRGKADNRYFVTSSENKQPVASATVTVKGTKNATTTDAQGNYKITVDSKATTLVHTKCFFHLKAETSINGRTVLMPNLIAEVRALEDVVVVKGSTIKKKGPDRFCFFSESPNN
ncbi:MAG: carboxypeptidase-like regulatory domain-containing protein [Chitinophagaceae bacterium]|nr:carboxypeptidase-like regulatory domain-containing protein [Chitinophagaceae bacterium]